MSSALRPFLLSWQRVGLRWLVGGVLWAAAATAVAAQQFEFTPQAPQPSPVPTLPLLSDPPGSTAPQALPPVPQVPQMPLDPTTPVLDPIPVVPAQTAPGEQASPGEAYSYQRRPDLSPGGNRAGATRGELPAGTRLLLTVYRPITFQPYQAISAHLEVAEPVVDRFGQVVIPPGSVVWGTFEPVYQELKLSSREVEGASSQERVVGSRFVAHRLTIGSSTYLVRGQSSLLPVGLDRNTDMGTTVARGAGYGAAGGLALGVLTGGWGFLPILAGSLVGAAASATNIDRVVTLQPNTLVELELTDSLIIQ
ncbi:hypothetical protein NW806_06945 [Synechococcus sp. W65.1]|jgi:hypothetical protein|uniref:hypothetical protein n=1 Tax=Synechococcus sp. W65.1 TaxID=2964526 RepID=UPI0039C3EE8A